MNDTVWVNSTIDLDEPPEFTEEQRAELEALAAMPDDTIDYSDAPPLPDDPNRPPPVRFRQWLLDRRAEHAARIKAAE
jgi:hypothetical protein